MAEMVAGLLDVTRAEGDPAVRRRDSVRLDALIQSITDDASLEVDHTEAIQCRLELVTIAGDQELIHRAVDNVVRNALRYAPLGTTVQVTLESVDDRARITVRDFGPGVPDEALEKIFSPFYRVDLARGHGNGGTGLGLALAQRAVRLHQGVIRAENARPGLRVLIDLPRNNSQ